MTTPGVPLLDVRELRTHFLTARGAVKAVDGVSFTLERGRTMGVVGESGSGKTVLSRSIMGMLPRTNVIRGGDVFYEGASLSALTPRQLRDLRRELGRLAYGQLFAGAAATLDAGDRVVVEANFHRDASEPPLRELARGRDAVVIECACDAATRRERFAERGRVGRRHAVHLDEEILAHEWSDDVSGYAIDIGCPRLIVDTSQGYSPDVRTIEAFARSDCPSGSLSTE